MAPADLGVVVGPAVMTTGEIGDAVDMRVLQLAHVIDRVEAGADIGQVLRAMKIHADLAKTHQRPPSPEPMAIPLKM